MSDIPYIIASELDKPSIYMGGPSQRSKSAATGVLAALANHGYVIVKRDLDEAHRYLVASAIALLPDMPTGLEPAGQSMDITMRQWRVREFRKAVAKASVTAKDAE